MYRRAPSERITRFNSQEKNSYENDSTCTFGASRCRIRCPGGAGSPKRGEPKEMRPTGTQMDAVTAGAVPLGVGAWAIFGRLQYLH
jgi:hypothetical protein